MTSSPNLDDQLRRLERRLERGRIACQEAERLLESKSLELYEANLALASHLETLELRIAERTVLLTLAMDEAEEAKRCHAEDAHHLQTVLDNILDGIVTIDGYGFIQSLNKAAETIFGLVQQDLVDQHIAALIPDFDLHHTSLNRTPVEDDSDEQRIAQPVELRGRHKNGSHFPMELALSSVARHGELITILTVRNIAERKKIERMKDEFISTVSHELRTPLTAICGTLGLIMGGALGPLPENLQHLLAIAQSNSQRLTLLINDFLDIEKFGSGKATFELEALPLMRLLRQSIESNTPYAAKYHVHYQLLGPTEDVQVYADSHRLLQVLANLLSNAAKFSPPGSNITIAVTDTDARIRVAVRDTGQGIPEHFKSRIFMKFSQADSSSTRHKSGSGLGLYITRELVERMQGTIGYESEEGHGSTFWVELLKAMPAHQQGLAPDRA